MICSVRELGIGDDHAGILVLAPDSAKVGDDALDVLGLRDAVLEIAVTPDRGYCLALRGLAREAGTALGVVFRDVADSVTLPPPDGAAYDIRVDDPAGCDRFSARVVTGLDPAAASPDWLARRLRQAGMRPISLAVDVTNYVMLETGQPLHAFDRAAVTGPIVVRRARAGERLVTLDGRDRPLHPEDLLVTDDSGPIGLAGVMGGASTEIGASTVDVLLEAAHWNPTAIARTVRRHRLPSEAAKRFERGVDPDIAGVALQRCVDLLVEFGGAQAAPGYTVVGEGSARPVVTMAASRPEDLVGMSIDRATVVARLEQVGCTVDGADELVVRPPSWRPDLTGPADLVEEVVRLEGYDKVPSQLPTPPPGHGLSDWQRLRRDISRALAAAGTTEVLTHPFVAPVMLDALGIPADDRRRRTMRVANPLSAAEPELRTSLLPGLLITMQRNLGRGLRDLALVEIGQVFLAANDNRGPAPEPGVEHRPSDDEIAAMNAALPDQPMRAAAVLCGDLEAKAWWGAARPADWTDAVELAQVIARAARVEFEVRAAEYVPWHPGRCARFLLDGRIVGHAGELHPRVVAALGVPERSCAMELDLDALTVPGPVDAPAISTYPPVLLDLALVVPGGVSAADALAAVRDGAGQLLESVRLFDVYTDDRMRGAGEKSLAFSLRLRAADRTLTLEEAAVARDAAVSAAAERVGARLRQ
jgi:phenylalanyl-tRNA synthetase beta chain